MFLNNCSDFKRARIDLSCIFCFLINSSADEAVSSVSNVTNQQLLTSLLIIGE